MSEVESAPATAAVPTQRTPADAVPAQAAPPAASTPPDVVREFQLVHDTMRHSIGVLVDAAAVVRPGSTPRAQELARYIDALLAFVHHHHTGEDEHWWPALRERAAGAGAALEPLTDDHHALDPLLDALRLHARLLAIGTHEVPAVRRDANALRDHLLEHLDAEEPVLLPLLAEHLEPAEAARLGKLMASTAPRAGLTYLLGAMNAVASEQQQRVILAKMPAPVRWLRPLMLRRYRRKVALLTRT